MMPIWGAFQLGILCCYQDSMETCLAGNLTQMAQHGSSWQACHQKTKTWVALLTQSWEKLGKGVLWNLFVFCLLYFKKTWNCHLATCKCKTNISLRQNMKDVTRENIPILFSTFFWTRTVVPNAVGKNRHDWSVTCRSSIAGVLQVEEGQIEQIEAWEISILDASFSAPVGSWFPRTLWGISANKFQLFVLWCQIPGVNMQRKPAGALKKRFRKEHSLKCRGTKKESNASQLKYVFLENCQ